MEQIMVNSKHYARPIDFQYRQRRIISSSIDELQTTNRFIGQLYKFERKNGVVMIEEHFPLTASAILC